VSILLSLLMLLLPLLLQLFQLLVGRKKSGKGLSDSEKTRLGHLMSLTDQLKQAAADLGVTPTTAGTGSFDPNE
jgi:hypothetical protein